MSDFGVEQRHVFTHPSRVEHWRHLVEILALTVAAAWAFYVFVYQERIKPAHETPVLDVSSVVSREDAPNGKQIITVLLSIKNIGQPFLQLDGFIINVTGIRYGNQVQKRLASSPFVALDATLPTASRSPLYSFHLLFKPFTSGVGLPSVLGPNYQRENGFSFALPRAAYDAISVEYTVCYQRADDQRFMSYVPTRSASGMLDAKAMADFGWRHEVHCAWTPPWRAKAL